MTFGSEQYSWLEKDLVAVNRTVTPWLVVEMHRPFYSECEGVMPRCRAGVMERRFSGRRFVLLIVLSVPPLFTDSEMESQWQDLIVGQGLQNEVEDLFHAYQVDLVISGHYRSYFRSCDGLYAYDCDNGGPTYVTVGTGGAPLDTPAASLIPGPASYTAAVDHEHFGVGKASVFNATVMRWEFVAVGGNVTDEVWLTRDPRSRA